MEKVKTVISIALECNMVSRKSPILTSLNLNPFIDCAPEPVKEWTCLVTLYSHCQDVNLLQRSYNEPLKYDYELQMMITTTIIDAHQTPLIKRLSLR
jgi:hypothetical protein